jgi:hypothetical protein
VLAPDPLQIGNKQKGHIPHSSYGIAFQAFPPHCIKDT